MSKSNETIAPKGLRPGMDVAPPERTSRGRVAAEDQLVADASTADQKRAFMRAVVAGLANLKAGRELPLREATARLDLK
jgi:hypothetical protein